MNTLQTLRPAAPSKTLSSEVCLVTADAAFEAQEVSIRRAIGELLLVVRESLRLEVVFVAEIVDGQRVFRHVSTSLDVPPIQEGRGDPLEETICQRILDGRLPAIIPNVRALLAERGLTSKHDALGAHIGVPVHMPDGRLYGMLCGFSLGGSLELDERDVKRLEMAAGTTARLLAQADGRDTAQSDPAMV